MHSVHNVSSAHSSLLPKVADLDVELRHTIGYFFTSSLLAIQSERGRPSFRAKVASNDEILLVLGSF